MLLEPEVSYEVYVDGEWVAASSDIDNAGHHAFICQEDGEITLVTATTTRTEGWPT